jgi:hypothetical protein
MKLTQTAIGQIKDPDIRRELTNVLLCTDQTIIRYINRNEKNGPLTTIAALNKIKECTGLTEAEILESEQEGEPVHVGK